MFSIRLADLDDNSRGLVSETLAWLDQWWDEEVGLLWQPGDPGTEPLSPNRYHATRESVQYALGLLMQDQPGNEARAIRIIERALEYQFDAPGQPYHGTFYRYPEEPSPPAAPRMWQDYDPNWREFIGSLLAIILYHFQARLPTNLVSRIDAALQKMVEGTLARPLPATYSNIALMKAFGLVFAGERFNRPDWSGQGEELATEIYRLFSLHDCFEEYNSPTYYGIDLIALGMWVAYSSSATLGQMGAAMEKLVWRDLARFYHAGLKNMCGPFDRSYGMDMQTYVTGVGLALRLVFGPALAPLPADGQGQHRHDTGGSFWLAAVGVRLPTGVRPHFLAFQEERDINQIISDAPRRVATAWLSQNLMLGGENAGGIKPVWEQYHPATIHWRCADAAVGWLKLIHNVPVDAQVEKNILTIESFLWHGLGLQELSFVFRISAPGLVPPKIEADNWRLPGLTVQVETNAGTMQVLPGETFTDIRYVLRNIDGDSTVFFKLRAEPQALEHSSNH